MKTILGSWQAGVKTRWFSCVIVCVWSVSTCAFPQAEDWLQFRGTNGTGISTGKPHPTEWSEDTNVAWKIKVPGVAWSQPVDWGNRIYLTTAVADEQPRPQKGETGPGFSLFSVEGLTKTFGDGGSPPNTIYQWKLLCLDLDSGDLFWERTIRESAPTIPTHRSNSYASETPATDGKHIYICIAMAGLYCVDMEGNPVWNRTIDARPMQIGWGTGSSPVIYEGCVFLQCDNEKDSFLSAFGSETGDELWSVERDEDSNWSTPWIWQNDKRTELVTCGGKKVRSYDMRSGQVLWEVDANGRTATTAVGDTERVFVGSVSRSMGSSADLQAIRAGASGDLSKNDQTSFSAWKVPRAAPQLASPLLHEGCLYTLQQFGGIVNCFDADTGRRHYRQRLPGGSGFTASPWAVGNHVFCLDESGQTFVLETGPEFKLTATNKLDGMFWSSAAVADQKLLLRSVDHLYCIAEPR